MTAARACGWFDSFAAANQLARLGPVIEPDPALHDWSEQRYRQFLAYWRATRRWHRN
jgi:hypothetical protein